MSRKCSHLQQDRIYLPEEQENVEHWMQPRGHFAAFLRRLKSRRMCFANLSLKTGLCTVAHCDPVHADSSGGQTWDNAHLLHEQKRGTNYVSSIAEIPRSNAVEGEIRAAAKTCVVNSANLQRVATTNSSSTLQNSSIRNEDSNEWLVANESILVEVVCIKPRYFDCAQEWDKLLQDSSWLTIWFS